MNGVSGEQDGSALHGDSGASDSGKEARDPGSDDSGIRLQSFVQQLYGELHALAGARLRGERKDHTLSPTALINEAFIRLNRQQGEWADAESVRAAAVTTFRRVLVDHARRRNAVKRGGANVAHITLDTNHLIERDSTIDLLSIDEALDKLAAVSAVRARVVELRFFGGFSEAEIGAALGLGKSTVQGHWRSARAWLRSQLGEA